MDLPYQDDSDFYPPVEEYFKQLIEDAKSAPGNFQIVINVSALGEAVDRIEELKKQIKSQEAK